jgi:hypothetical protein
MQVTAGFFNAGFFAVFCLGSAGGEELAAAVAGGAAIAETG